MVLTRSFALEPADPAQTKLNWFASREMKPLTRSVLAGPNKPEQGQPHLNSSESVITCLNPFHRDRQGVSLCCSGRTTFIWFKSFTAGVNQPDWCDPMVTQSSRISTPKPDTPQVYGDTYRIITSLQCPQGPHTPRAAGQPCWRHREGIPVGTRTRHVKQEGIG